jgi:1,4-alpha-glucan branching enzyme
MIYLADRFPDAHGILLRALNQAAREVLLSQHSDWTFIMKNNTAAEYAKKRFEEHIGRFTFLYQSILSESISEEWLTGVEDRDRIFQDLDYRIYSSRK